MAIADLETLLNSLTPSLDKTPYVFCTFPDTDVQPDSSQYKPLAIINEVEGVTWIIQQEAADEIGLEVEQPFSRITLNVHSSLTAVGLTAAVSTALAQQGISANVVAAFYHDYIFVPQADANHALKTLHKLSNSQQNMKPDA